MYRKQINITLTDEQAAFVKNNYGKMNTNQLSIMLGISRNKIQNNLRVLNLHKPRSTTPVIQMEGYFNVDEFTKQYKY